MRCRTTGRSRNSGCRAGTPRLRRADPPLRAGAPRWRPHLVVIGIAVFTILTTWRTGRRLVRMRLASESVPLADFLATCDQAPEARVSGTAIFLTTQTED